MDEVKSRIIDYMNHMGSTDRAMALKCGIDPSNFSKMMKGTLPITEKTLRKILAATQLNEDWLLTGEGEMLRDKTYKIDEIEPLTPEEDAEVRAAIERGVCRFVPLINIDSVGGMSSSNALDISEQYVMRMIPFAEARDGDVAILQSGNSMYPTIPSGSILLLREVEDWREYFGYGNIYVLLLRDGRRITKEIRRYDEDPRNYVWCVSYNPDVADEELPRSLIRGVWKVITFMTSIGW